MCYITDNLSDDRDILSLNVSNAIHLKKVTLHKFILPVIVNCVKTMASRNYIVFLLCFNQYFWGGGEHILSSTVPHQKMLLVLQAFI